MKSQRILGIVARELRKANDKKPSARIKVMAYYSEDELIKDPNQIIIEFGHQGYVFAPSFDFNKFKIGTLIEFSSSPNTINTNNTDPNYDQNILDLRFEINKYGIPLFEIKENIFFNDYSIDPDNIKYTLIGSEISHFYIKNNNFIIGPFKVEDKYIIPYFGKEVSKFNFQIDNYFQYNGHHYLINPPIDKICKIDCMTNNQIADWIKDQMKLVSFDLKIKDLKQAFQSIELLDIEKARLGRAIECLDNIVLNIDEFKEWAQNSKQFNKILEEKLIAIDKKLEEEKLKPLQNNIRDLDERIKNNIQINKNLEQQIGKNKIALDKTQKKLEEIVKDKDRIIKDIRIQSEIINYNTENNSLSTFHIDQFNNKTISYNNLDEFALEFNNSIKEENEETKYLGNKLINQLTQNKLILSQNVEIIVQLAKLSNNCNLVIQQVEPDWLKFDKLFYNGLSYTWESATAYSDVLHFLVLEDFNLSAIECYAKPILDINLGIRSSLPKLNTNWPENLKIFISPLNVGSSKIDFPLPLLKTTYSKKCGAFPILNYDVDFNLEKWEKYLQVEMLKADSQININFIEDYFKDGN